MKILITHPDLKNHGGVSSYWKLLQGRFGISAVHFTVGKRTGKKGILSGILRVFADYWRFLGYLKKADIDLVHLNPSLDPKSFIRDGTFSLLARVCRKKTVVFFHGWQMPFEASLDRGLVWVFKLFFGKSNALIVLSDRFRKTLQKWGVVKPIYREVTIVGDDTLKGFNVYNALRRRHESQKWRVLFLSRILRAKGIYETVQAVSLLQAKYPIIELVVAGDGNELEKVKSFAHNIDISNIIFSGYVQGKEKRRLFEEANIFCLPSYSEGFPVAIVEAMAFGLPVVTRFVGGLVDFFENGEHGFISESLEPKIFANFIEELLVNKNLYEKISLYNYQYAQSHFLASCAALRLEQIYRTVLSG